MAEYKSPDELNDTPLVETFDRLRVVSAKYVPWHDRDRGASASLPSGFTIGPGTTAVDVPIPEPYPDLIHQPSAEEYLETGHIVVDSMRRILAADGFAFSPGRRVLDFGCFNGRLLRWLLDEARAGVEFWGVDIDAHAIEWVAARMSPPFRFAVTTTEPHLPFPDDHFDLIYAGSVFTHMADLAVAWLLELKRVLKPGGRAYLTFNDEVTIARILDKWPDCYDAQKYREATAGLGLTLAEVNFLCIDQTPYASIFYNRKFLTERLSGIYKLKTIVDDGFYWQAVYLLEKQAQGQRVNRPAASS